MKDFIESGQLQGRLSFRTKLNELMSKEATSKYESIRRDFGWDNVHDRKPCAGLEECRLDLKGQYPVVLFVSYVGQLDESMMNCIGRAYPDSYEKLRFDPPKRKKIMHLVVFIATLAFSNLMIEKSKAKHRMQYNLYIHTAAYQERETIVECLMSGAGVKYQDFRKTMYSCILSCLQTGEVTDDILVIVQDGVLLHPDIILGGKPERTSVFDLVVQPGAIRTEFSQRYKYIREVVRRDYQSAGIPLEPNSVKAFSESKYIGVKPKTDWMPQHPELLANATIRVQF